MRRRAACKPAAPQITRSRTRTTEAYEVPIGSNGEECERLDASQQMIENDTYVTPPRARRLLPRTSQASATPARSPHDERGPKRKLAESDPLG
ncbi:hypothetical protein WJ16_21255 [Burkholderia metallica]|nr:hypothetical protein WJ16_21255 [Burkholderia metallica]